MIKDSSLTRLAYRPDSRQAVAGMYMPACLMSYNHHILGQPGTGKTTVLINQALKDIYNGHGLIFIDPHGDAIDYILSCFPADRVDDLIHFDPSDINHPMAFNPLQFDKKDEIPNVIEALVDTMRILAKYDTDVSTNLFDKTIGYTAGALVSGADNTVLAMSLFLSDPIYRQNVVRTLKDKHIKRFWLAFDKLSDKKKEDTISSAGSLLDMLLLDPRLRNCLGQHTSAFRLKEIIKDNKVLLVRLPLSKLSHQKILALGSLINSSLFRAVANKRTHTEFRVFIDDVHYTVSPALLQLLPEAPRHNVGVWFTHHYLEQVSRETATAFSGNASHKTYFRLSVEDGEALEKTMEWSNTRDKLFELRPFNARVVTPNGVEQMETEPLAGEPDVDEIKNLINLSRLNYAGQRRHVEEKIDRFIGG
jgi:hypothetical protein